MTVQLTTVVGLSIVQAGQFWPLTRSRVRSAGRSGDGLPIASSRRPRLWRSSE
jgi:hypothetical protein